MPLSYTRTLCRECDSCVIGEQDVYEAFTYRSAWNLIDVVLNMNRKLLGDRYLIDACAFHGIYRQSYNLFIQTGELAEFYIRGRRLHKLTRYPVFLEKRTDVSLRLIVN